MSSRGWFFAGFPAPIAAAALAFSDYLAQFFPALDPSPTPFPVSSGNLALKAGGAQLSACAPIGFFTPLNCLRGETVAKVQHALSSLKVVAIVSFILLGLTACTPIRPVLAQGVCAMLLTFTSFPQLVVLIGFTLTTMLAVASVFVFRRGASWKRLGSVIFAYPPIPLAYTLLQTGMTVYGLVWQPVASIAALVTIAAGALVYWLTVVKDSHLADAGS
jgi:amino acid transporter